MAGKHHSHIQSLSLRVIYILFRYTDTYIPCGSHEIMNQNSPEQVPFELLHLELVSQVIHADHEEEQTTVTKTGGPEASPTSRLELLGFNTGYRFIERLAKDYPKFKDELDLLKFICKDFWVAVFRLDKLFLLSNSNQSIIFLNGFNMLCQHFF